MCCQVKWSERKCQPLLRLKHYLVHFEIYKPWRQEPSLPTHLLRAHNPCYEDSLTHFRWRWPGLPGWRQGLAFLISRWTVFFLREAVSCARRATPSSQSNSSMNDLEKKQKCQTSPWISSQTAWVCLLTWLNLPKFRCLDRNLNILLCRSGHQNSHLAFSCHES